jgi:hypothetical protein
MEVLGERGVEGFACDLTVMVTDGNAGLEDMSIASVGERRVADGTGCNHF